MFPVRSLTLIVVAFCLLCRFTTAQGVDPSVSPQEGRAAAERAIQEPQNGPGGNEPVPEPGTLFLVGSGLVGWGFWHRRRNRDGADGVVVE